MLDSSTFKLCDATVPRRDGQASFLALPRPQKGQKVSTFPPLIGPSGAIGPSAHSFLFAPTGRLEVAENCLGKVSLESKSLCLPSHFV